MRWGVLDLLDVLKTADFLTGFTDEFSSVAAYEPIDRATLQRRLLLALFALGTNMGIRAIVATGEHGETEAALRTCAGTSSPSTTSARPSPGWLPWT
ncbi:Tn3 family transposase [Streptomyces sp. NPDC006326]|uniref:Tn3 family transposase n=1 Tax=Streptomyces sp. NPDC006326 TaxID=3156752 RepID=UPI0033AA737B